MDIINYRQNFLNVLESNTKGNDNFSTELISTENLEGKISSLKKCRNKKKNQTFFSKLLPWAASLKVTSVRKLLHFYNSGR